mgnify:CR=1 FL=1
MAKVLIKTSEGDIKVRLYDETPQHRDNFLKLAKEGYFDGTLFHRVHQGFYDSRRRSRQQRRS